MSKILFEVSHPFELSRLCLSDAIQARLDELLDRQDRREALSSEERLEAEQLVDLAELLTLLRLRTERLGRTP